MPVNTAVKEMAKPKISNKTVGLHFRLNFCSIKTTLPFCVASMTAFFEFCYKETGSF
ncbi:MAG: hypothetical protein HDT27_02145 [Subdoligranulum sp.]|nr:hypothetical protein [Subdoligranulum sp.]MBD5101497.1 hypothetical protein [Subdoligranulum sp.]